MVNTPRYLCARILDHITLCVKELLAKHSHLRRLPFFHRVNVDCQVGEAFDELVQRFGVEVAEADAEVFLHLLDRAVASDECGYEDLVFGGQAPNDLG